MNAVGWSSSATTFTFTSTPTADPYYLYMDGSFTLAFNTITDIVEEPCKSPASIIGYKVEMGNPQKTIIYVSSTDTPTILEIQDSD